MCVLDTFLTFWGTCYEPLSILWVQEPTEKGHLQLKVVISDMRWWKTWQKSHLCIAYCHEKDFFIKSWNHIITANFRKGKLEIKFFLKDSNILYYYEFIDKDKTLLISFILDQGWCDRRIPWLDIVMICLDGVRLKQVSWAGRYLESSGYKDLAFRPNIWETLI